MNQSVTIRVCGQRQSYLWKDGGLLAAEELPELRLWGISYHYQPLSPLDEGPWLELVRTDSPKAIAARSVEE